MKNQLTKLGRRVLLAACFLLSTFSYQSWAQPFQAASAHGSAGFQNGTDVWVDNFGNTYAVGFFSGTITFGSSTLSAYGDIDIYLVKYDNCKNVVWVNQIGGPGNDFTSWNSVKVHGSTAGTTTRICVTGAIDRNFAVTFTGASGSTVVESASAIKGMDIFLACYNPSGVLSWKSVIGGNSGSDPETGMDVLVTAASVYITGQYWSSFTFNGTTLPHTGTEKSEIFVAHYVSSTGAPANIAFAGGADEDIGTSITEGETGYIYTSGLCGYAGNPASFKNGPTLLYTSSTGSGYSAYVAKLSTSFTSLAWTWVTDHSGSGGGPYTSYVHFHIPTSTLYHTGAADGPFTVRSTTSTQALTANQDIYLTALTTSGAFSWSSKALNYGHTMFPEYVTDLMVTGGSSPVLYLYGNFYGYLSFGSYSASSSSGGDNDIYIAKFNPSNGSITGLATDGGFYDDVSGGFGIDYNTSIFSLNGTFYNNSTIGGTALTGTDEEAFLAQFSFDLPLILSITGPSVLPAFPLPVISANSMYTSFQWYRNGIVIPGANSINYSPSLPGQYTCVATRCGVNYKSNVQIITESCVAANPFWNFPPDHTFVGGNYSSINEVLTGVITIPSGAHVIIDAGSHIIMTQGSVIRVQNNAILDIDNSMIEGCAQWLGIEVEPGGSINIRNSSKIKDALVAVSALNPQSLSVTGSFFEDNCTAIGMRNYSGGTMPLIQNNSFKLMDYAAPYISAGGYQLPFTARHDYVALIASSGVDIQGNDFEGIEVCPGGSIAACAHDPITAVQLMGSDHINITQANNFHDNFDFGVKMTSGTTIQINENAFSNIYGNSSIWADVSNTVNIQNNSFYAGRYGIDASNGQRYYVAQNSFEYIDRSIVFYKIKTYDVNQNTITRSNIGMISLNDNYFIGFGQPECLISDNHFNFCTYGLILSPKENPLTCTSSSLNTLAAGNPYMNISILCNDFEDNNYAILGSADLLNQYGGKDPGNTFTGATSGVRQWDILWHDPSASWDYYYNAYQPNTSLALSLTGITLNGTYVGSTWSWINFVSTSSDADCYYDALNQCLGCYPANSVKENTELTSRIYPNPANDLLNVDSRLNNFVIVDVTGREVSKGTLGVSRQINISELKAGTYFIKLEGEGHSEVLRFIKL